MSDQYQPIHINDLIQKGVNHLPDHAIPARASLTVNCLIPLRNESVRLIYYNFDPKNWNQWYPIFTFYHCDFSKRFASASDLLTYIENESSISQYYSPTIMERDLINKCKEVLNLKKVELIKEPLLDKDYWLKYSKTKNVWTLYCFIFYCVQDISPVSAILESKDPQLSLINIDETEHNGITIVENTVELIQTPSLRQFIIDHAI